MTGIILRKLKSVGLCLCAALIAFAFYRVLFFALNRDLFGWVTAASYARLFFVGFLFDLAGLAYFNLPYVILALLPLPWLSTRRGGRLVLAAYLLFNTAANLLASIDLIYYRYTLTRSTRTQWNVAFSGGDLGPLLGPIILQYWPLLLLLAAVTVGLAWVWKRAHGVGEMGRGNVRLALAQCGVLILALGVLVIMIRGGVQYRPMELNTANYLAGGENVPLVTNTPYVMVRTFRKADLPKQRFFDDAKLASLLDPVKNYGGGSQFKPRNVVVIVMESMSLEYLGPPWGRESLTPNLDALAARGLFFPNAYANGKQSIEAIPAITASVPSLTKDPFVTSLWSGNVVESLASLLAASGYDTAFYHGGRTGTMGIDGFAKASGYARYLGLEDYTGDGREVGEWGVPDEPYLAYFSDELAKMKKPFFATVFTLSAHHPFKLPPAYEGKFPEGKHPITKMVSYADEALGKFFEKASKENYFRDTLFVLTADHSGPSFAPEFTTRAGAYAIPILFYAPGDEQLKGVSKATAQQLDIMPTVLDYLGYPSAFFSLGRSALREGRGFAVNSRNGETLCVSDDHAVTRNEKELTGEYDLATDRMMKTNLAGPRDGPFAAVDEECKAVLQTYSTAVRENRMTASRWRKAEGE